MEFSKKHESVKLFAKEWKKSGVLLFSFFGFSSVFSFKSEPWIFPWQHIVLRQYKVQFQYNTFRRNILLLATNDKVAIHLGWIQKLAFLINHLYSWYSTSFPFVFQQFQSIQVERHKVQWCSQNILMHIQTQVQTRLTINLWIGERGIKRSLPRSYAVKGY